MTTGATLDEALRYGEGTERPFRCSEHEDNSASASVNVVKGVWVCLDPATRVLTADLHWVPIGTVCQGDDLVGFDEHVVDGQRRSWRRSTVKGTARVMRPCYEVELSDGTIIVASADHQWLAYAPGHGDAVWRRTDQLITRNGNPVRLCRLLDTWDEPDSWQAGYAAAGFDGEGTFLNRKVYGDHRRNRQIRFIFYQSDNAMLEEMRRVLKDLDIEFSTYQHVQAIDSRRAHHKPMSQLVVQGKAKTLRALGMLRPQRLLEALDPEMLGIIAPIDKPTVVRTTNVGAREVVAVETSSGTYVAEGLASHNCYACGAKGRIEGKKAPTPAELAGMLNPEADCRLYPESWLELFDGEMGNFAGRFPDWIRHTARLGCDPLTGDATFPVRTPNGRLAGVGRRIEDPGDGPRYRYPPRWSAASSVFCPQPIHQPELWIVEGAADATAVAEVGAYVFAMYGAGVHLPQRELIARANPKLIVVALDSDDAGHRATYGWDNEKGDHRAGTIEILADLAPVIVGDWGVAVAKDPGELTLEDRQEVMAEIVRGSGYGARTDVPERWTVTQVRLQAAYAQFVEENADV